MKADWYFDFVSPFSYLAHEKLATLPKQIELVPKPVLFAGLLGRWGHKGPAEIPAKRLYTGRYCVWFARENGIRFAMPPAHPFNPLGVLRLSVSLGPDWDAVATIFRFIWQEGRDVAQPEAWAELGHRLGIDDVEARISDPSIKARLREATEGAIALGVFGVPTVVVSGSEGPELFWGVESLGMLCDYVEDRKLFSRAEMARLRDIPKGAERRV